MKLAILALLTMSLTAEVTVYFAPNGKTYCVARNCLALSRSKTVLSAPESQAIAHGLTRAKLDAKTTHSKSTAKNGWAQEAK
jgi:hypothetical protein